MGLQAAPHHSPYPLVRLEMFLDIQIVDRLINDFLDFFLGLRGGRAFCVFEGIRKCISAYVFVCG